MRMTKSAALTVCAKAAAIEDYTVYDEAMLRRLRPRLDEAISLLQELPAGTLAARKRLLAALQAIVTRPVTQTGGLLALRQSVSLALLPMPATSPTAPATVPVPSPRERTELLTPDILAALPVHTAPLPEGTFQLRLANGHLETTEGPRIMYEMPSYDKDALYYGEELSDPIMTGREYLLDLLAKYDAL